LLAQGKPSQIISGRLRLAAGREDRAAIMLEKANPSLDIAGVPHVPVDGELCTKEGGAQLRD
jgi:hypothetical protein